ncbi:transcription elongation factor Elf1 like-domain-containing protein [Clohesyomyces aquaticus]|uniref:Transcription elongation factor 1 homolog n=1 Tax=Clohesyomyces aquaticus TaxID=1231657 RepID=A0A1Y1XZK8_9PLEO|nr:transcription elongation factor Elf1 like-domain-containing protein [Clohesyomyces aquaticus]
MDAFAALSSSFRIQHTRSPATQPIAKRFCRKSRKRTTHQQLPRRTFRELTNNMGKRKSSKKVQGPKKEKLPTVFQCLFCNHEHSVSVTIDKKSGVGNLICKVCGQQFQTNINYLSAPVDVYADWIDACDAVAKEAGGGNTADRSMSRTGASARPAATAGGGGDALGDDFIVDDELDAEGDYDE